MSNLLKKITIGNPLINFGMREDYEAYQKIKTAEELAAFYHRMLDETENRPLVQQSIYAMITFSTGVNINADQLIL